MKLTKSEIAFLTGCAIICVTFYIFLIYPYSLTTHSGTIQNLQHIDENTVRFQLDSKIIEADYSLLPIHSHIATKVQNLADGDKVTILLQHYYLPPLFNLSYTIQYIT